MGDIIVAGFALMLVIEGILPLAAPRFWRSTFAQLAQMRDGQIRFAGLLAMVAGLILLFFAT
jgi:uncharacterized protein YjeT (DUF2065 family)